MSVTGESDAIKYIQTLPGVSTGAEGASAIYVRGGNIGSNVMTLMEFRYSEEAICLGLQAYIRQRLCRGLISG